MVRWVGGQSACLERVTCHRGILRLMSRGFERVGAEYCVVAGQRLSHGSNRVTTDSDSALLRLRLRESDAKPCRQADRYAIRVRSCDRLVRRRFGTR